MQQAYRHTQFGLFLFVMLGIGIVGGIAALAVAGAPFFLDFIFLFILVFALALTGWMTVEVSGGRLSWRMGIGLIGGSAALSEIREVEVVRNPWYYGWGMHLTPDGWLYNVSGSEGVRVKLASGKSFRLGSDEPQALADVLRESKT